MCVDDLPRRVEVVFDESVERPHRNIFGDFLAEQQARQEPQEQVALAPARQIEFLLSE